MVYCRKFEGKTTLLNGLKNKKFYHAREGQIAKNLTFNTFPYNQVKIYIMNIKYAHTNIITKDWKELARFYEIVFNCIAVPPIRNYQGEWLEKGTGVFNANLQGVQLRLPGYGDNGPTLEIYQYSEMISAERHLANQKGFGHIAFNVEDIAGVLAIALKNGASKIGELSEHHFDNIGVFRFIYISDPDGNIIELLNWS